MAKVGRKGEMKNEIPVCANISSTETCASTRGANAVDMLSFSQAYCCPTNGETSGGTLSSF